MPVLATDEGAVGTSSNVKNDAENAGMVRSFCHKLRSIVLT